MELSALDQALHRMNPPTADCIVAQPMLDDVAAGLIPGILRFTVSQYHDMCEAGILPSGAPVELVDGLVVWKDRGRIGGPRLRYDPSQAYCVKMLYESFDRQLSQSNFIVRSQHPITLSEKTELEPDISVVRGAISDYGHHHPGPEDTLVVIEIADSSLAFDRTTKLRLYASAAIPTYWILNLRDNQLEQYFDPIPSQGKYAVSVTHDRDATVRLAVDGLNINVDFGFLPKRSQPGSDE